MTYKRLANSSIDMTTANDRIRLPQVQEKAGFRQMEFGMRTGRPSFVWRRIQRGKAESERTVTQRREMAVGDRMRLRSVLSTLEYHVRSRTTPRRAAVPTHASRYDRHAIEQEAKTAPTQSTFVLAFRTSTFTSVGSWLIGSDHSPRSASASVIPP